MIRILGCGLIIGATTLLGISQARNVKEQYVEMQYLYQIICSIQSEIRYARAYLSEIFSNIGKTSRQPYKRWLTELGTWMETENRETFENMWQKSIGEYLPQSLLPKKEMERLVGLGSHLGIMDIQMQVRVLEMYLEQLTGTMNEVQEKMKTKVRLCYCLGVMSGMFVSILLL
ncbi:MAG: stage III sporulation protein AB [Dorea sp.]